MPVCNFVKEDGAISQQLVRLLPWSPIVNCLSAAEITRLHIKTYLYADAQRDLALQQSMVKTIGRCLLASSDANVIAPPSFPISTGLATIRRLMQQPGAQDAQACEQVLWTQVWQILRDKCLQICFPAKQPCRERLLAGLLMTRHQTPGICITSCVLKGLMSVNLQMHLDLDRHRAQCDATLLES